MTSGSYRHEFSVCGDNFAELFRIAVIKINRPGFPEAGELPTSCKLQKGILSDGKEIHIIYGMIGFLLVGKTIGLFDITLDRCQYKYLSPQTENS